MFGPVEIVASKELGSFGARVGEAVTVHCPIGESLKSTYLRWVLLLLLLRRANRTGRAWYVLLPLAAIYLILDVAQRMLNAYFVFHYHQSICTIVCELLRYLALSVAILLTLSDLIRIKRWWLRLPIVLVILLLISTFGIRHTAWPLATSQVWVVVFAVFLTVLVVGHAVVSALLYRITSRERLKGWYAGLCLVLGICPILVLGSIQWVLSQSLQRQSSLGQYRVAILLAAATCVPYFVLFWFVLLASCKPLFSERWARAFGVRVT